MKHTVKDKRLRIGAHILFGLLPFGITGCVVSRITSPAQTAVEQLLLSTAADRAIAGIPLEALKDKQAFLDTQYLDSYRSAYVIGALREALDTAGVILTEKRDDADIIIELRAPTLSIDESETMIGVPSVSFVAGGPALPEGPLYKKTKQDSIAKLSMYSYDRRHKSPAVNLGSSVGTAYYYRWRILFLISFRTTNLEDK